MGSRADLETIVTMMLASRMAGAGIGCIVYKTFPPANVQWGLMLSQPFPYWMGQDRKRLMQERAPPSCTSVKWQGERGSQYISQAEYILLLLFGQTPRGSLSLHPSVSFWLAGSSPLPPLCHAP